MKFTVFLLLIISYYFSYSQKINYIDKYHKVIYNAEKMITKENYDSALYFFDKAFNNVPYAFCYDYGNAAYIAYKTDNKLLAVQYLDSAILKGMRYKKQFKRYFDNNKEWKRWKDVIYDSLYFAGVLRLDSSKIRIVDSLYQIDQKYRGDKAWNLDSAIFLDSSNAIFIMNYLKNNTLSEMELGFVISNKLSTIYLHQLLNNQQLMYELYKSGQIEKRSYYYAIVRKSLQFGEDSKFLKAGIVTSSKEQKLLDTNRQKEGIPYMNDLIELHRFANKSHSLFFTLVL